MLIGVRGLVLVQPVVFRDEAAIQVVGSC